MAGPFVLHEYSPSGNCYKVRLTAALVDKPLERVEYDILKGETRTPEFLRNVNAQGQIPVLEVQGRFIPESNAACHFLAQNSDLLPRDPFDHADMLHWMFWEQYHHEPNIATLRFWMCSVGPANLSDAQRLQVPIKREKGIAALKLMDDHLARRDWFVGKSISLADVCLFAYTHVAGEAGFEIKRYPNVERWIQRTMDQPRFLPMDA